MSGAPTWVARLTPPGSGGVAVIEVRGPDARARLARLTPARLPGPGGLTLVRLVHGGETLDEALVCVRGEGWLELHLHGSPPLVAEVLALLGAGGEGGEGGEGVRQPTSVEDRARSLLARAPCELGARILLDQARGALRREVRSGTLTPGDLGPRWAAARWLLEPARVVLAGPANGGKSTLFNLLVGERRVTVHERPGTTRDTIAARAHLGPWPVELWDTAGERPVPGEGSAHLERAGQALAARARARADLVLWLTPLGEAAEPPPPAHPAVPLERLHTQADRQSPDPASWPPDALSALAAPDHARDMVRRALVRALDLPSGDLWVPGRGVPFERALVEDLAAAWGTPGGAGRRAALARVLDGLPAPSLPDPLRPHPR